MSTDIALAAAGLFAELAVTKPAGDWQQLALCAEADPELFYPEARESARQAKAICMGCEVRVQCLGGPRAVPRRSACSASPRRS